MNWRSALTGCLMLCSALAAMLLVQRGIERAASRALAIFVALASIASVPNLIGFAGAYDIWPGLTFLPTETILLLGPLILLHARALMVGHFEPRYYWLFLPGIAYLLYQIWAFTMLGSAEAKWAYVRAVHAPYVIPIVTVITWAIIIWCVAQVYALRRNYLLWLADNHADDEPFDPVWLGHLVFITIAGALYWIAKSAISYWFAFDYFESFPWDLAAMLLVLVIVLEALARMHQGYPKMGLPQMPAIASYEPSGERDWAEEGAKLRAEVIANKWFLEPKLSLQVLSRRYGMNHVYLSRAINDGLGCNFNTFINALRVEHALGLIDADHAGSLTEIAMDSGFGSKASFNRAFKQHVGINPSEYRKKHVRPSNEAYVQQN